MCAAPFLLTQTHLYLYYREFTFYGHMLFTMSSAHIYINQSYLNFCLVQNEYITYHVCRERKSIENAGIMTAYIYAVNGSQ